MTNTSEMLENRIKSFFLEPPHFAGFMVVILMVFCCFIPDLQHELLNWDDSGYVTNNQNIRTLSLDTLKWSFTTFYTNYWAPLTWLSLAVDYSIYGLNPFGYHLTNNIIHALNAGIFYILCYRMIVTRNTGNPSGVIWTKSRMVYCSLLAALIFGIHPLRVESVAWVTERKDVLCMFFGLLTVLSYLKYTERYRLVTTQVSFNGSFSFMFLPYYWLTWGLFTLSMLSKSMFVTLPVMLLVIDWYLLDRCRKGQFVTIALDKIPLLIVCGVVSLLTMQATAITRDTYAGMSISSQVIIAVKSLLTYLQLFIWPLNINTVYLNPGNIALDLTAVVSTIILLTISIVAFITVKKLPLVTTVWLLFLIPFTPVISVSGIHAMAPRFTYLPTLSFSLAMSVGIVYLSTLCSHSKRMLSALIVLILFMLSGYAAATVYNIGFWKNDIVLWTRVIDLNPNKFGRAYFQRSLFLQLAGEHQKALSDVNEALRIAQKKQYAELYEIYGHRAVVYRSLGDYQAAVADFTMAIESSNEMYRGHYLNERGRLYEILGKSDLAAADFTAAARLPKIDMNIE